MYHPHPLRKTLVRKLQLKHVSFHLVGTNAPNLVVKTTGLPFESLCSLLPLCVQPVPCQTRVTAASHLSASVCWQIKQRRPCRACGATVCRQRPLHCWRFVASPVRKWASWATWCTNSSRVIHRGIRQAAPGGWPSRSNGCKTSCIR